jgi:hypothetical protein
MASSYRRDSPLTISLNDEVPDVARHEKKKIVCVGQCPALNSSRKL